MSRSGLGGRAYRAYRFPQRKGGRMSRRPGAVQRLGPLASGLGAFILAMIGMGGFAAAAVIGYFAADLPAAHDLAPIQLPLSTQIYYGNQAYGVEAAAKTYFNIADLSKLTLGQMALLAGLPQAPSSYDPIQNPAAALARRAEVLQAMVDNGYISESEADTAKSEPIKVQAATTSLYAPHFTFRVREQLIKELGEKNAYEGGYTVLTSLDWNTQQLAEKEVKDHVDALKGNNVNNAALITMDPATGELLAYVGSYDYYMHTAKVQGDYDHAGIALRQPGSTFKLFTYLTGMLKA